MQFSCMRAPVCAVMVEWLSPRQQQPSEAVHCILPAGISHAHKWNTE